jgi:hypothetical protein
MELARAPLFTKLLSKSRPTGRAIRLALIAAVLGAAVVLGVPLCPFAIVTRVPCPGCGLTRATLALLHGHLHEAMRFHPLAVVVSPVILGAFSYNAFSYVTQGRWTAAEASQGRWVTLFAIVVGTAMLGVWIARFFGAFGGPVPV